MTRAEYESTVAQIEALRGKATAALRYQERIGAWMIEAVVAGLPSNPPGINVTDAGKHPADINGIPAEVLTRAAHVKAALLAWWNERAEWPTAPMVRQ